MRLLLDAGNSTVAAALADRATLTRTARLPAQCAVDETSLRGALEEALGRGLDADPLTGAAAASVVPTATDAIVALAVRLGIPLTIASAATVPLPVGVERPDQVGPDRLVNAFAAAQLYGTPAIVVDAGTATTWECIDGAGTFVGGAIAPGLELGLRALSERTALLPRVGTRLPAHAIGRDTIEAIRSGTVLGHRELVEGLTARMRAELAAASGVAPDAVHAILTGGLAASAWGESIGGFEARDPDLTLRGLALLAEIAASTASPLGQVPAPATAPTG
jgi:type III pantothenate kinase